MINDVDDEDPEDHLTPRHEEVVESSQHQTQGLITSERDVEDRKILEDSVKLLASLESNAQVCAASLAHLIGNLRNSLHAITAMSVQQMNVYKEATVELTNTINLSVLSANTMIQKAIDLEHESSHLMTLGGQIKDLKKSLDMLELLVQKIFTEDKSTQNWLRNCRPTS